MTPKPVYLVFASKVVRAMDCRPDRPRYLCNQRYYDDQGKPIRAAASALAFPNLADAKAQYEGLIAQHERIVKAHRKRLMVIEDEMAREAEGEG